MKTYDELASTIVAGLEDARLAAIELTSRLEKDPGYEDGTHYEHACSATGEIITAVDRVCSRSLFIFRNRASERLLKAVEGIALMPANRTPDSKPVFHHSVPCEGQGYHCEAMPTAVFGDRKLCVDCAPKAAPAQPALSFHHAAPCDDCKAKPTARHNGRMRCSACVTLAQIMPGLLS